MIENDESGERTSERLLAQVAAERHPEAFAAELPESWWGAEESSLSGLLRRFE